MANEISRWRRLRTRAEALWNETDVGTGRFQKFVHFWILVWKSFNRNRCPARASALAYASLLALIPMLAVVVSVTSSLLKKEGEQRIDNFIVKLVASVTPPGSLVATNVPLDEATNILGSAVTEVSTNQLGTNISAAAESTNAVVTAIVAKTNSLTLTNAAAASPEDEKIIKARREIARNINQFIQNTRSGTLGVFGGVLLIFAAISMLSRIEDTLNDIWGVQRGRGWFTRIILYWGVITLVPVLLVGALGLATGPHWQGTRILIMSAPWLSSVLFRLLPLTVLCMTFSLFYMLMPNTKVRWQSALAGGVAAGLLIYFNNLFSVLYVSRVVSNSKIYGSLGLVPVFMIGLYLAWWIMLFGAQVAYAFQNRSTYLEEKQAENVNQRGREFIALRLMTCVGQRFLLGQPPPTIVEICRDLSIPTRLIQQTMHTLGAARLVVETAGAEIAYLPARPLERMTCHDVLQAMRAVQGQELATRDEPARVEVYGEFNRIQQAEQEAASCVTIAALAHRALERQIPQHAAGADGHNT